MKAIYNLSDKVKTEATPEQVPLKFKIRRFIARASLFALYLTIRITPIKLHEAAANVLGKVAYRISAHNRKTVARHLEIAFGGAKSPEEIEAISVGSMRNMLMNMFEFIRFPSMNAKRILRMVTFEGEENIKAALEKKRGVIVLSAHFGNWELLGAALVARGYPLTVVRRDQADGLLNDVIQKQRDKKGIKTVPRDKPLFVALTSLLKANELVALIADQNAGPEGIFVNFFGRPAATFKGPGLFKTITGAPIIPIFLVREGYWKHRVVFLPPVTCPNSGDVGHDIVALTQGCTKVIEDIVAAHPEQWMWQHKRWKTEPPGVE